MPRRALDVGDTQRALMAHVASRMEEQGLSLRALGGASGINRTRLMYLLRGERAATVEETQALCDALGMSLWRLLRSIEDGQGHAVVDLQTRVTVPGYGERVDLDQQVPAAALDYADDVEQEAEDQSATP